MGIYDYIFSNAHQQDSVEAEKAVRAKYPLLLHEKEQIVLAFKDRGGKGRDKHYFTTHRVLLKDGKGLGSKCKNYRSISYPSIQAFSCDTAGMVDGDVGVTIYSRGIPEIRIEFGKNAVDIFQVQQFLNSHVSFGTAGGSVAVDAAPPNADQKQSGAAKMMHWLGNNAATIDQKEVESMLKASLPVLLADEKVELAFKSGRDMTVFTDRRYLTVDVQGLVGKKIVFTTVLWDAFKAFSVQTAGAFLDGDTEMKLYTNIPSMEKMSQDFQKGKSDLFAVQMVLCNHILGPEEDVLGDVDLRQGREDEKGFWWFRDNQRPLDAVEMDRVYHSSPCILRGAEHIELAFKGRRDITLFTNLRIIIVDPKGLVGKQVEYTSIPWTSVVAHTVRTAGKFIDFDSEVGFYTEMKFFPGSSGSSGGEDGEGNPPVPARPKQSYFELDFNKKTVDMDALNYYLSRRLLLLAKTDLGAPVPLEGLTHHTDSTTFGKLFEILGNDQQEMDTQAINAELHTTTQILLDDETVVMAFKAGRDVTLFTNVRVLHIDVQGIFGAKIEYLSLPYKSIRAWSVETAGVWDADTELNLYTQNRWHAAKIEFDFRTGKADIQKINRFLSALLIGRPTDNQVDLYKKSYASAKQMVPLKLGSFGLFNNAWEIDRATMDAKLRNDPAILLDEETTLKAFQSGRDATVYTDRRVIIIDVKGITGKTVKYKSIPLKNIHGFEFETAGHLDRDAEIYQYTNITDVESKDEPRVVKCLVEKQSLLVKQIDIYEIGKIFLDHLFFKKGQDVPEETIEVEPEIEIDMSNWTY